MSPRVVGIKPWVSRGITEWDLIYVLDDQQMRDLRDGQRQALVDQLVIRAKRLHRRSLR
jgi:hypothetical protein